MKNRLLVDQKSMIIIIFPFKNSDDEIMFQNRYFHRHVLDISPSFIGYFNCNSLDFTPLFIGYFYKNYWRDLIMWTGRNEFYLLG